MSLTSIIKQLYQYSSYRRLYSYLKHITEYHRIQGSKGLLSASNYISSVLSTLGIDNEIIRIDKSVDLGLLKIPVGWNVYGAELRLVRPKQQLLLKLEDHPTMVLAHSPPSNGWVEGELIHVGRGTRPEDYEGKNVSGKLVLAYGSPYYVYKEASKRNALGIIYYRRNAPDNAVPYAGLFLTIDEAREAKTIGLSVSNNIVKRLLNYMEKNEKVLLKAKVDAEYDYNPILPVVLAYFRGLKEEGYGLIAHLCHPKPGAHDNASGSAALLEAATILSTLSRKKHGELDLHYTLYFIWVPEYLGTQGLFSVREKLLKLIRAAVNLDMVGAKPDVTGSVLHHINSSIGEPSYLDALLEKAIYIVLSSPSTYSSLSKTITVRYDHVPYEGGSDHDVFISYGIPASMLNQWPDKFYHTDMDDIENIDPVLLTKISVAALSTLYFISTINSTDDSKQEYLLQTVYDYYNIMINERMFTLSEKELQLREKIENILVNQLSRVFDKIEEHFDNTNAKKYKEYFTLRAKRVQGSYKSNTPRPRRLFHGILSIRAFYDKYRDKVLKLLELVEKNNKYTTVLLREALHLANGERTIDEIYDMLVAEYGIDSIDKSDLERFYRILESMELVALS